MNNFTKTESLPKAGHVNEVCKEWLVREDGALAYKLQSQEINEFYKGNRFRNAVVREDFPTALHEQIKEHEHAEQQTEAYRRRLTEQEEHDKHMAREIAEKLERDLQEQQQKELHESEIIAQQMQEIYVNLPPVPPPTGREKSKPPPPRPHKASILQQQSSTNFLSTSSSSSPLPSQPTTTSLSSTGSTRYYHAHEQQEEQPLQQQQQQPASTLDQHLNFTSNTDGYVGLCLMPGVHATSLSSGTPQRSTRSTQQPNTSSHLLVSDESPSPSASSLALAAATSAAFNQFVEHSKIGRSPVSLTNDNFINDSQSHQQKQQQQHAQFTNRHQHSISNLSAASTSSASGSSVQRNVFEFVNAIQPSNTALTPPRPTPIPPITPTTAQNTPQTPTMHMHSHSFLHTPPPLPPPQSSATASASSASLHPTVEELIEYSDVADSIRNYERSPLMATATATDALDVSSTVTPPHLTPTHSAGNFNRLRSPSTENLLKTDQHFQKLSPEKYDQMMGNENGLLSGAAAERHMQQHADDIELYVDPCDYASLREIGLPMHEIKEMSKKIKQEQKDELLARRLQQMEAHDGLTQEQRDRLMAIEAQDKELAKMLQEREKAKAKRAKEKARLRKTQQKDGTTSCASTSNGLHCGPLMSLPQDCMSAAKNLTTANKHTNHKSQAAHPDELLDMEAYSNPIDIINNQRIQNGTLTNGSLLNESLPMNGRHNSTGSVSANQSRDDDIYTLPVDSCRPGARPASLSIGPESSQLISQQQQQQQQQQHNSMTRSENYSLDSQHELQNGHDILPRLNYSKSSSFDQNSSPTPPYMPIQGTRRSHLGEDRKKKSKDKCTHQ